MLRTLCTFFLALAVPVSQVFAQVPEGIQEGRGSEFFVGRIEGKPLMKVHLLSGVHFPGVYHIPVNTNLASLISYAGGVVDLANLDDIYVRTTHGNKIDVKNYDLTRIISRNDPMPEMQDNDIVRIPTETVDRLNKAYLGLGILGAAATIFLTVVLIRNGTSGKSSP